MRHLPPAPRVKPAFLASGTPACSPNTKSLPPAVVSPVSSSPEWRMDNQRRLRSELPMNAPAAGRSPR